MANYRKELKIGVDIRRKRKIEKTMEFEERIKKMQEKVGAVLKRVQKKIKQQVDRGRNKAEV